MTAIRYPRDQGEASRLVILKAIADYEGNHRGLRPSLSDLVKATGLSKTNIRYHVNEMQERGWVSRVTGVPRSLNVTKQGKAHLRKESA